MWRRQRSAAVLFILLFAAYFLFYASLGNWMAGRSYGPRYLVPFIPALVLPLAFWFPSPAWRRFASALAVLSVAVQIPGVVVDYSKVRVDRAAAGETVAQDMRWQAMPLLLNVRAAAENTPRAIKFLSGVDAAPQVEIGQKDLSSALSFSLDFWWLYLAYLGLIGRVAGLSIATLLAVAASFAFRQAWKLAG
jgi:hypothetical protein